MYISRKIEITVEKMLKQFKVVLVTGARQVGKTTMLKNGPTKGFSYTTLDDPHVLLDANNDNLLFFKNNQLPLVIDEVQKSPELFKTIKFVVDKENKYGQIVLTGSQTYQLMKNVSESLAGRICILEMPALSLREIYNLPSTAVYTPKEIDISQDNKLKKNSNIWEVIQKGSMPELYSKDISWDQFWTSYTQAYLERDVRDIIALKNERKFYEFMISAAARTGQLFSASDIANDIGTNYKTVQNWVSVLQAGGIIKLLYPFWPNISKSVIKTPKLYFMDTGLVCHLTRWNTAEQLQYGAMAGHIFETFVVSEVLKSYMNSGANTKDVWFYRDNKKREIDLILQNGRTLHPVEIKKGATVEAEDIKNFKVLDKMKDYSVGFGHVICLTSKPYFITENVQAVSVWEI